MKADCIAIPFLYGIAKIPPLKRKKQSQNFISKLFKKLDYCRKLGANLSKLKTVIPSNGSTVFSYLNIYCSFQDLPLPICTQYPKL